MYECTINNSPIMRRCKDDWVNATQILKCCNFPKAKRTKILEKGVQQGLHEKIQGGYGRFQGTWIPLANAQKLAASYGVTPEIAPVLYIDTNDPNLAIPKKTKQLNKDGTPVKRRYTKKKKLEEGSAKKPKYDGGLLQPMNTDYALQVSFGSMHGNQMPMLQLAQQKSNSQSPMAYSQVRDGSQMPNNFTQADFMGMGNNNVMSYSVNNLAIQNELQNYQYQFQRMQQQLMNVPYSQMNAGLPAVPQVMTPFGGHVKLLSQSTNETTWSQDDNHKESDTSISSVEDHVTNDMKHAITLSGALEPSSKSEAENYYASQLLKFFSEDNANIPYFIQNPPYDFDISAPIDDEGHTPLHWSASIGNDVMIHLLISKGANPLVVNNYGLNPLSKLVSFNNCYELKNFPKILEDLKVCLINTDINGRTPLHYICQFSKVKSKIQSLNYYITFILDKLSSAKNSFNSSVNLLKNVIDHQDVNGDTALHLAAKSKSAKFVKLLLNYGARDDLVNVNNETARFIIVQNDLLNSDYDDSDMNYSQYLLDQRRQMQAPQSALSNVNEASNHSQILTPVQPSFGGPITETPDTQRTTLQEDDDEEDTRPAKVKEQLDNFTKKGELITKNDENKENIFADDSMKSSNSMSTPIPSRTLSHLPPGLVSLSHQPLAVISEKSADSLSTKSDAKSNLLISSTTVQTHVPRPPQLDEEGRIVDGTMSSELKCETHELDNKNIPITDLSTMMNSLINSLTASYEQELSSLTSELLRLETNVNTKEHEKEAIRNKFKSLLGKYGIEDFDSVTEGKNALMAEIEKHKHDLGKKVTALSNLLSNKQSLKLSEIVENELEKADDEKDDESNKLELAINLSKLQIQRSKLASRTAKYTSTYGIDTKMYKYRKLISLSCGLKVEDIDGLIDGIEESLMETSAMVS